MTDNDAAERLHDESVEALRDGPAYAIQQVWGDQEAEAYLRQLDAALAAERHATVERIRAAAVSLRPAERKYLAAILDAEVVEHPDDNDR